MDALRSRRCLSLSALAVLLSATGLPALAGDTGVFDPGIISSWLLEHNVPAVGIGIIQDSKLSKCGVFGELQDGIAANETALFRIASLTKPVTSIVTLKLIEQDQWDLDEPLYHYWIDPDIQNDPKLKLLTTRHVLSHQSGFPNWRDTTRQKRLYFEFEPGTEYRYSGEGFEYLRRALERKFETSLEELADVLLFTPLDMHDTSYRWVDGIENSRFAFRHDEEGCDSST